MSLLVSFLAALAAAPIVLNIAQTAAAYPSLPGQVPMQFNWDGSVRNVWPRPMMWFTVAVQIFIGCAMLAAGYAITMKQPGTHGSLLGLTVVAVCVNAMMWRVQKMLLSAAKSSANGVSMTGFLPFFAVCFAVILIAVFVIG